MLLFFFNIFLNFEFKFRATSFLNDVSVQSPLLVEPDISRWQHASPVVRHVFILSGIAFEASYVFWR